MKELFKGLAMEQRPFGWQEHPVVHIDFSLGALDSPEDLERFVGSHLDQYSREYGLILKEEQVSMRFAELIRKLAATDRVVVLIDEYDKPILDNINSDNLSAIKRMLEGFYTVIESADPYLRFVLLAGVSRFSKVSLFSNL